MKFLQFFLLWGTILLACLDLYSDSRSGSADPFGSESNPDPNKHSCEVCSPFNFLKGTYPWLHQAYPSLSANEIPSMATSTWRSNTPPWCTVHVYLSNLTTWKNKILHCVNYVHAAVILFNVYGVKRINKNSFFPSFFLTREACRPCVGPWVWGTRTCSGCAEPTSSPGCTASDLLSQSYHQHTQCTASQNDHSIHRMRSGSDPDFLATFLLVLWM